MPLSARDGIGGDGRTPAAARRNVAARTIGMLIYVKAGLTDILSASWTLQP